MTGMGKESGKVNLGRGILVEALVKRIRDHFERGAADPVDQSLVVGVFGEWGSGKTWVLESIAQRFAERGDEGGNSPRLTIPIRFNPWRYEAETHLIVPLMMTARYEIEGWLERNKTWIEAADETARNLFERAKKAARFFARAGVAVASGFKGSLDLSLPGLAGAKAEFDPQKILDALKTLDSLDPVGSQAKDEDASFAGIRSIYYEFERRLGENVGEGLNLLFLVDDIDRCLPDRAVQMMEAIKLFLDVPGCAFVLGLDDEVVERGIIHRYRDYLADERPQVLVLTGGVRSTPDESGPLPVDAPVLAMRPGPGPSLPITGMEYLEKIIHLPVRLPQLPPDQARALLVARFPDLFSGGRALRQRETSSDEGGSAGQFGTEANALLEFLAQAVPPVPRKLVRAGEMLRLFLDITRRRDKRLDTLLLARIALLQLFAPEVYRHIRRTTPTLLYTMAKWRKEEHGDSWLSEQFLYERLRRLEEEAAGEIDPADLRYIERYERPLIRLLIKAIEHRSGFDARVVIEDVEPEQLDGRLLPYFLVSETAGEPVSVKVEATAHLVKAGRKGDVIAELTDPPGFLEALFAPTDTTWRAALDDEALQGKVLPDEVVRKLYERLDAIDGHKQDAFRWWRLLADNLGLDHRREADQRFGLRVYWKSVLASGGSEVAVRQKAADCLAMFGDDRAGVGVHVDPAGLPDIEWIPIEAGPFTMGSLRSDKEKGQDYEPWDDEFGSEEGPFEVDLPGFRIARYPVTNAQFNAFVAAGGYGGESDAEPPEWWRFSDFAQAWWRGEDRPLLEAIKDEDLRKRYTDWLEQRPLEKRRAPYADWSDDDLLLPNRPVVGVSWFEATAYARWLEAQYRVIPGAAGRIGFERGTRYRTKDLRVALPTEAQWEKAARWDARNKRSRRWSWGDEWAEGRANTAEAGLDSTSAVGLFTTGASAAGADDMTGNVWEWTTSRWGVKAIGEPDAAYRYPYDPDATDRDDEQAPDLRVVRGGSWRGYARLARCATRDRFPPEYFYFNLGFRLVLSLADADS